MGRWDHVTAHLKAKDRPGDRFHKLVASLEGMFAARSGVKVDAPLRLRDKDTGRLREHDVVITRMTHHGANRTALECRDRSRQLGVPQVEAFAKKWEKTGIHHGILVSTSGFTTTAIAKAAALNLSCMTLSEAERFTWIGKSIVICQFITVAQVEMRFRLSDDSPSLLTPITVNAPDGSLYRGEDVHTLIFDRLPLEVREARTSCMRSGRVFVPLDGFYVVNAEGGRFAVVDVVITYELDIEVREGPITLHNYTGEATTLDVASAGFEFPSGQTTVAFVKSDEGIFGHLASQGGSEQRIRIGDLPERRFSAVRAKSGV